jgi:hypothetical protein
MTAVQVFEGDGTNHDAEHRRLESKANCLTRMMDVIAAPYLDNERMPKAPQNWPTVGRRIKMHVGAMIRLSSEGKQEECLSRYFQLVTELNYREINEKALGELVRDLRAVGQAFKRVVEPEQSTLLQDAIRALNILDQSWYRFHMMNNLIERDEY